LLFVGLDCAGERKPHLPRRIDRHNFGRLVDPGAAVEDSMPKQAVDARAAWPADCQDQAVLLKLANSTLDTLRAPPDGGGESRDRRPGVR
jgi:hypothetical protein